MKREISILSLSGGLDSTVALYTVLHHTDDLVLPITFDYGQSHFAMENRQAASVLDVTDINFPGRLLERRSISVQYPYSSADPLLGDGSSIPEGEYSGASLRKTVIPGRNTVFVSTATQVAAAVDAHQIVLGIHASDGPVYPDCTPEWLSAMNHVNRVGNYPQIEVVAPLLYMSKAAIVWYGFKLGAPLSLTYSCYKGGQKHCGTCGTCKQRRAAFQEANIGDPARYDPNEEI